ncbi:hypothetical protein LP415_02860 [Polaromonas sp. P1(28)-8]|nr:hypothetical protein LP415_02860 [Polaromonas sp. P1(28)-8]
MSYRSRFKILAAVAALAALARAGHDAGLCLRTPRKKSSSRPSASPWPPA